MLTEVEIINKYRQQTLRLPMNDLIGDSFIPYPVTSIDGLSPVDVDITTTNFALNDGIIIQGVRRGGRNLVLTMNLNTDYASNTVESLRHNLYGYLSPGDEVELIFEYDTRGSVRTSGIVETFVTPMFTDNPQAQVSIMCPVPYFSAVDRSIVSMNTVSVGNATAINYDGTYPAGLTIGISPTSIVNGLSFKLQSETYPVQKLEYQGSILVDESFELITTPLKRGVWITNQSGKKSTLNEITMSSDWLFLRPGSNMLTVTHYGDEVPVQVSWYTLHVGA